MERLQYELLTVAHAAEMVPVLNAANVSNLHFFETQEPITVAKETEYLTRVLEHEKALIWLARHEGHIVGTVGLHEIDTFTGNARLGLIVYDQADRGKGYGEELVHHALDYAFGFLGLQKTYLRVFAENAHGARLYLKCGFQFEARLMKAYRLGNTWHDMSQLCVLTDWYSK